MEPENNEPVEWMTAEDVAEHARLSLRTIYNKVGKGTIPHHKQGRIVRFIRAEIDAWLRGEWPNLAA